MKKGHELRWIMDIIDKYRYSNQCSIRHSGDYKLSVDPRGGMYAPITPPSVGS